LDENLTAAGIDREKSQEVRKFVTSDSTPESLNESEEADRDGLATDTRVNTLFESIWWTY